MMVPACLTDKGSPFVHDPHDPPVADIGMPSMKASDVQAPLLVNSMRTAHHRGRCTVL